MAIYDISIPVTETMTIWPGDPPVQLTRTSSIERGDPCNLTEIRMGAHSGTHIDAPCHFIEEGITVDRIPLGALIGQCLVCEVMTDGDITVKDLEGNGIGEGDRVLFKTANSENLKSGAGVFDRKFTALSNEAALYLAGMKVSLVGIDYLSIEGFHADEGHPVHRTLLQNNVVVVEGLDLSGIRPGPYELICLPLRLFGAEGSPARAILRDL